MIAKRVDENQKEIVDFFRKSGFKVKVCSSFGGGFPDLMIKKEGVENTFPIFIEVKDGKKPRSKQKLTTSEAEFFEEWGNIPLLKINSLEQAEKLVFLDFEGGSGLDLFFEKRNSFKID